ncbi:polyhydroxybutyrate depolymerase [Ascidiaceihabitans sp.]|uniref:alpha/beta hydrolase family esterase n=1 Tax=Ascidiaceihabitans sp. TaxID=1872644 RepID=UPI00329921D6
MQKVLLVAAVLGGFGTSAWGGCGPASEACEIDEGSYHVTLPAGDIKGSIMFLHGFGGSGAGTLSNKVWVPDALDRGYAVIGPDGTQREGRNGRRWSFHPDWPKQRDDMAFLKAVRDDAATRFDLDTAEMALGGFSIGGSMTSYLACATPDAFKAYLPVGGGFWRPHPVTCAGPVRLLHTHGWTDTTVPLEGRVVRGEDRNDPDALIQGDIFYTVGLWRDVNQCLQLRADRFVTKGDFLRRSWIRCAEGSALEFAIFPGGHKVPQGWADMALDWFENL